MLPHGISEYILLASPPSIASKSCHQNAAPLPAQQPSTTSKHYDRTILKICNRLGDGEGVGIAMTPNSFELQWHQAERMSPALVEARDEDDSLPLSTIVESPHYLLRRLLITRGCIIELINSYWERLQQRTGLIRLPGFASTDTIYGIGGRATISAHAKIQLERHDLTEKNLNLFQANYFRHFKEKEFERKTLWEIVELEKVLEDVNVEIDRLRERLAHEMPEWSKARWAAIVASARERVAMVSEVTTVVKEAESLD
ncbi:hypothetical protein CKM354_001251800 [Cercospora kikuchii]|uniref:Uncharacterized protein n=1 Tax=Cercospora kikuchii TaxID=84275 RepID=A0A9P3FM54_9PEZI|nr:uncharacterized protein CKM354_001251800 [Cercospora kikuchii]GIZ49488.1 hypothetical protein CKM354_001251800 [Cercospora kikuchii]